MPRNLDPRVQVVLEGILLGAIDLLFVMRRPGILAFGGFPAESYRWERRLAELRSSGAILRKSESDSGLIRLTNHGCEFMSGGRDPATWWGRPWDGRWRMVVFDVAEVDRTVRQKLRRTLREAGLGRLQDSVWISPQPLDSLKARVVEVTANPGSLLFLEGVPHAGESDASIVEQTWDFPRLNERYREVLRWHASLPRNDAPAAELQDWLQGERQAWLAALRADPLLPVPLHPADYLGPHVERLRAPHLKLIWGRIMAAAGPAQRS